MKLSKLSTLFFVIVAFCFAIGFTMGAFPDRWRELRGEKSGPLLVLTSSPELIPSQFFLDYEKATGNRVELKIVESFHLYKIEAQEADLLFAPLSWLGSFGEILKPLPGQDEFHALLSTDFDTLKLDLEFFLPVLWKTEQRDNQLHLRIWGFATSQSDREEIESLMSFLLTNPVRLQEWSAQMPYAFTLQESNVLTKFPETQRAQQIRQVSLPNLVIDQKEK